MFSKQFGHDPKARRLGEYVAGMMAAQQGRPITDCPHERKSKKKEHWLQGWRDGDVDLVRRRICERMNYEQT